MKVQVEELSPIERKLAIEVERELVDGELAKAYAELGRHVKIAGFRPGKIPRRILEQRFKSEVEADVMQKLVQRAYIEAVRQNQVDAVADPQVTPKPLKPGEPFAFDARVEIRPRVEVKDYLGLELKRVPVQVGDEKVQARLEDLRRRLTRLEPVSGRDVAQANDYAQVDYEATCDGKPFPGSKAENITVRVAPGELVEANIAALEGTKVGEVKELDYVFPADHRVEEVKGKTAHFKISLKGLKTEIVPELDDAFAKDTGGADSLEALKARIRSDLEKAEKLQAGAQERDQIVKLLVERNPFEVPRAMVEQAIDAMLEGALRQMARSGLDPRRLNLDLGRLREEMRERATSEVKGSLLFDALATQEKIEPSEEEIDKRIEQIAQESDRPQSAVQKAFRSPADRKGLALRLREEKAIEFVKASAKYS